MGMIAVWAAEAGLWVRLCISRECHEHECEGEEFFFHKYMVLLVIVLSFQMQIYVKSLYPRSNLGRLTLFVLNFFSLLGSIGN